MTDSELDALEAAARKATPGPWEAVLLSDIADRTYVDGPEFASARSFTEDEFQELQPQIHADARYIAAANPAVVIALVEELRRMRAIVRDLAATSTVVHYPMSSRGRMGCVLCSGMHDNEKEIDHEDSCPWRRAVEEAER